MRLIGLLILLASYLGADSGYFWLGANYGSSGFGYTNASGSFTGSGMETTGGKIGYQFGDQAVLLEYNAPTMDDGETMKLYLLSYRLIGADHGWPLGAFLDITAGQSSYSNEALGIDESNPLYGIGLGFLLKFHQYILFEAGAKTLTSNGLSENDVFNVDDASFGYVSLIIRF